jgi:hypothetical protein
VGVVEHETKHLMADGETKVVERQFDPIHIDAGYAEQEWGEPSRPDHPLLGKYETTLTTERHFRLGSDDDAELITRQVPVTLEVRHLEVGPTGGPEFEMEWSDGLKVTVLDDLTVIDYLKQSGSAEEAPDDEPQGGQV